MREWHTGGSGRCAVDHCIAQSGAKPRRIDLEAGAHGSDSPNKPGFPAWSAVTIWMVNVDEVAFTRPSVASSTVETAAARILIGRAFSRGGASAMQERGHRSIVRRTIRLKEGGIGGQHLRGRATRHVATRVAARVAACITAHATRSEVDVKRQRLLS